MRLAVCAISAVLLSGCSWLGIGSSSSGQYGHGGGAFGANCLPGMQGGQSYGHHGGNSAAGCGPAGGYSVAGAGYGAGQGFGATGYGMSGVNAGLAANGVGYGAGMNGVVGQEFAGQGFVGQNFAANSFGATTTLGANAPYGAAVGGWASGQQYVTTDANSQIVNGAYQTVQGAPIYVPQPYAVPYGVSQVNAVGAALPFALAAGIGTEFSTGGDIFPGEAAKGDVSELDPISYKDAFDNAVVYDLGAELDLSHDTTLLARVGYSKAEGSDAVKVGSITQGSVTEDLYAEFSDLEQYRFEGGVRKYVGGFNNGYTGLRPYVGATAGFVYTDDVDITQSSATLVDPAVFTQEYVDGGWQPTASGLVGAEWQVGPRTALGVETGIRWTDNLDTNFKSDDRWSVPLQLRGRVAF